jgi:ketosteroid isomerase-like protein
MTGDQTDRDQIDRDQTDRDQTDRDDPVRAAEDAFFGALLAGDANRLEHVLAADFQLVDVMAGQAVPREALLHLLGSGAVTFAAIERDPATVSVRHRPGVAVVLGATRMTIQAPDGAATVDSRYTHVYVRDDEQWRLLAAQGTRFTAAGTS